MLFFDIESTGLNVATDRIVEISAVKVHPNGDQEIKTRRINPTIMVPNSLISNSPIKNMIRIKHVHIINATFKIIANTVYFFDAGAKTFDFISNLFILSFIL